MIATVNITTVTTVTSFATNASLALIGISLLLLLLIQKEVVVTISNPRAKIFGDLLNIAIAPLIIIFLLIVGVKLIGVVG